MACRRARMAAEVTRDVAPSTVEVNLATVFDDEARLLFGVDSKRRATTMLQNNIDLFEWVVRNKVYPSFWGRNITGENCLTVEEIEYLHKKACKIAAIYNSESEKVSEESGLADGKKAIEIAREIGIENGAAIFLEIGEVDSLTWMYMNGFASNLIDAGYTPGFKADTDAKYIFDREYSRGVQNSGEVFSKCIVWAVSPSLPEFNRVKTTHFVHLDNWGPYAPSGIMRKEVAVWQYGKECHPIYDENDTEVTFNVDLLRNRFVYVEKMF